jgi:dipeptidyl aminopeptidase/acylaminoacyl peptidase
LCAAAIAFYPALLQADEGKKPLTLKDIMKFKEIHDPVISEKGDWVIYNTQPDRGNGQVIAVHVNSGVSYAIERGAKPIISRDSNWVAAVIKPDFVELGKAAANKKKSRKKNDKPKNGMALLETGTGKITAFKDIKAFTFSNDSRWMFYCLIPPGKDKKKEKEPEPGNEGDKDKKPETSTLVLRRLADGKEMRIEKTSFISFDPASRYLAYSVYDKENNDMNGLYVVDLEKDIAGRKKIHGEALARYSNMAWSKTKSRLAFIFHKKTENIGPGETDTGNNLYTSAVMLWDGLKDKLKTAVSSKRMPTGWVLPHENELSWTKDETRLYFGFKPVEEYKWSHPPKSKKKNAITEESMYDIDLLREKRGVDVWHWQDPLINPNQKKQWDRFKKRIYTAVYLLKDDRYVRLADRDMREVQRVDNPDYSLGFSRQPYLREITWDGRYRDVYYINLRNGAHQKFLTRHRGTVSLSYNGRFAVYYKDKHWYLYSVRTGTYRLLTGSIKTPFFNEDHDYPYSVPGYGIAGWTEKDRSVLIYDKYDIWEFPTGKGEPVCLTGKQGRENKLIFRVNKLDPEQKFFKTGEILLLNAYSDEMKYTAFYNGTVGRPGIKQLLFHADKTLRFVKKAKKGGNILFTRENFEEFPDLWVSTMDFSKLNKISDVNPQRKDFLWGKAELIEWKSFDGRRLQGVVIKPENYDKNKRYPVLVYYYRFFTQRLHRFNQVVINHRPCFPYYTGNGYVVFLPDIRFQVGRPGFSAAKCLVPGVQKLIDMGIADPKAIGLHGHSWSGYQTAFIVTQTDIFAAAIAGAPVTNMTSAYNGIRWGSGLARQFQYEKSQSRIGASLTEAPHLYIENSPVFFADRIKTPLLIQFGDKDGAVPWYQGIELYLTMRRLNKNCIFLQYNDEPHHLKKYPNKLDYTIKMKEYLDHYLKGAPAPDWITKGVPYRKK